MIEKKNFYINGKWVSPSKPNNFEVIDPSTEEPFAIISLGSEQDVDGAINAAKIAFESLKKSDYQVQINHPFKGGYITRFHGNPEKGVNSIQLEMSKDLYMSENETIYDQKKANKTSLFRFNIDIFNH